MKVPNEKHQAHTGAAACLLWGIDANSCHMVKGCPVVLFLCLMSAAKGALSAFGMLARNLEHPESISDTLRQPDHPSPQIPVCVNRTMSFQCDGNPKPKKAPALSKSIRLNSLQRWVGSPKNNLIELLKETLTPAGGHQIAHIIRPLGSATSDNFSIRPPSPKDPNLPSLLEAEPHCPLFALITTSRSQLRHLLCLQ